MKIQVLMLAYGVPGEVREVEIADDTPAGCILDEVFRLGQNDFQPQQHPSVSVGDVIVHNGYTVVRPFGFASMTAEQLEAYKAIDRRDRAFSVYVDPQVENE